MPGPSPLARLVRRRRLELRLTQRQAAQRAGVSLATWQSLERHSGEAGFQDLTLARVAHGLGMELSQLLSAAGQAPATAEPVAVEPRPADENIDAERMVSELADALLTLHRESPEDFLVAFSNAVELTSYLLERRRRTD